MSIKYLLILIISFFILGCSEKTSYSGTIISKNLNLNKIDNKNQLLSLIGNPSYIDPFENKFYYYSEEKKIKNTFNQKIIDRKILVFSFDNSNKILLIEKYNLDENNDIKILEDKIENNILERGIIEKIFGGIGKQSLPNTP